MKTLKVTLNVEDKTFKKFKKLCNSNGETISGRINILLKKDIATRK